MKVYGGCVKPTVLLLLKGGKISGGLNQTAPAGSFPVMGMGGGKPFAPCFDVRQSGRRKKKLLFMNQNARFGV